MSHVPTAFWLLPDWSGGDNMRDPGVQPFWMKPALPAVVVAVDAAGRPQWILCDACARGAKCYAQHRVYGA